MEDDLGARWSPILAASSGRTGLEGEGMQKSFDCYSYSVSVKEAYCSDRFLEVFILSQ